MAVHSGQRGRPGGANEPWIVVDVTASRGGRVLARRHGPGPAGAQRAGARRRGPLSRPSHPTIKSSRREHFEAAVCGIWLGERLLYLGTYIDDAQRMALPLVGGHLHDGNWILSRLGLLSLCRPIAAGVHALAFLVLIGSLGVAVPMARARAHTVPAR